MSEMKKVYFSRRLLLTSMKLTHQTLPQMKSLVEQIRSMDTRIQRETLVCHSRVPAASESEAYENLGRVQKLNPDAYIPAMQHMNNALTLSEAPLG
jgi:hypothetical protein